MSCVSGSYFFQAFVRAGLLEELLKYFAIRRLLHKPYLLNARALLVYGTISGTAFGVLENITYSLMGGLGTAIVRSLLTVPLHASTGLMIGANLVSFRFRRGQDAESGQMTVSSVERPKWDGACLWLQLRSVVWATLAPVLLHGTCELTFPLPLLFSPPGLAHTSLYTCTRMHNVCMCAPP